MNLYLFCLKTSTEIIKLFKVILLSNMSNTNLSKLYFSTKFRVSNTNRVW